MQKILFFIPNLCGGGAEKVLVNLCNNLFNEYDVTVLTLYDDGVYIKNLDPKINYKSVFKKKIKGLRIILKFFPIKLFLKLFPKGNYDIVVSYLEGVTTKILADYSNTKYKIAWVHSKITFEDIQKVYNSKKSFERTYKKYDKVVFVSNETKENFEKLVKKMNINLDVKRFDVIKNINESEKIKVFSKEKIDIKLNSNKINCAVVGKIAKSKGIFRIINIFVNNSNIREKYEVYFIGVGPDMDEALKVLKDRNLEDSIHFLGYQNNPYKIMSKMDLIVCPSYTEGLSTVITEAVILGKAIMTTDCGGMKEILGDSKFGYVVSNDEEGLKQGFNFFTDYSNIKYYENKSIENAKNFERKKILDDTINLFNKIGD